jgi:Uma2 family endonuclease
MSETAVLPREIQQVQAPPISADEANDFIRDPYNVLWTTADVDEMPDVEGVRFEILQGDIILSKQPNWEHQAVCTKLIFELQKWCELTKSGQVAAVPGVLFSKYDNVVPDVVWITNERLARAKDEAGHLLESPELMIEVISYGKANIERDRETKLEIYNRYGTDEYWIADWRSKRVQIHRRVNGILQLVATRLGDEIIESPLLPGFNCPVSHFFN